MEIIAVVLVWPLLILMLGIVFILAADASNIALVYPLILVLVVFLFGLGGNLGGIPKGTGNELEDLDRARRGAVAFSIALLLPIFVKYLLDMTQNNLVTMILGLILGFGILVWGMFLKGNKVLTYANIVGGIFVIVYLYFQLWTLGQLAQVVATAFGLIAAIIISVVKFREKLA